MKCPVCDNEKQSMLCPSCGFDSSKDYGRYPALGPVRDARPASVLRRQWQEKQRHEPEQPAPVAKKRKRFPLVLLMAAAFAVTLGLGVWIGMSLGGEQAPGHAQVQSDDASPQAFVDPRNILRKDDPESLYVYGTDILKSSVRTVAFLDTLENAPENSADVSKDRDGSVRLWSEYHGSGCDLYFAANGPINADADCSGMFMRYTAVTEIVFDGNFCTDEVTDMREMFRSCCALKALDLSSFDTSSVQDMYGMFQDCFSLASLELRSFDTSWVQDMRLMFYNCNELTNLDLSGFDTSCLEESSSMFFNCPAGADWQHLLD